MTNEIDQNEALKKVFELQYAALRQPIAYKRKKSVKNGSIASIDYAVSIGDVDYIEAILVNGDLPGKLEYEEDPEKTIYAMAHWLVDGSGRANLAQRWMNSLGHTPDRAALHFKNFITSTNINEKLIQQKCLGLSTLFDVFEVTPERENAAIHDFSNCGDKMQLSMNVLLASLLLFHHPSEPPSVPEYGTSHLTTQNLSSQKKTPLILHICKSSSSLCLLQAIEMAYDSSDLRIKEQLIDGINTVIKNGRLPMFGTVNEVDLSWGLMKRWGGADLGHKIWNGNTAFQSFPVFICINWNSSSVGRLNQVLEMGIDVNDLTNNMQGNPGDRFRMLDAAVGTGNVEAIVWLLDKGANPMLQSECKNPSDNMTSIQYAESFIEKRRARGEEYQRHETILSMLRSAAARIVAQQSLKEIEFGMGMSNFSAARFQ